LPGCRPLLPHRQLVSPIAAADDDAQCLGPRRSCQGGDLAPAVRLSRTQRPKLDTVRARLSVVVLDSRRPAVGERRLGVRGSRLAFDAAICRDVAALALAARRHLLGDGLECAGAVLPPRISVTTKAARKLDREQRDQGPDGDDGRSERDAGHAALKHEPRVSLYHVSAMRKASRIKVPLLAVAGVWLCLVTPAWAADAVTAFGRGIGMSHVMAWAAIAPGPARQFVFPPFTDTSDAQFTAELRTLRRTGFEFVRFAVDPGPFLQFQGERRDRVDRILVDRVNLIRSSGLAVIVDFHPSDMHPDYTAQRLTAGATSPVFQSYLQLIERTARLLGALHSNKIAFELMNEPPVPQADWQPMLEAAYVADVPYPAQARPLHDSLAATAALIAATDIPAPKRALAYQDAQARLEDYRASDFNGHTIAADFARVADWAKSHGIPADHIQLGEFGANQTPAQESGARAA